MKGFQLLITNLIFSASLQSAESHTERVCLQVPIFRAGPLMVLEPGQHVDACFQLCRDD